MEEEAFYAPLGVGADARRAAVEYWRRRVEAWFEETKRLSIRVGAMVDVFAREGQHGRIVPRCMSAVVEEMLRDGTLELVDHESTRSSPWSWAWRSIRSLFSRRDTTHNTIVTHPHSHSAILETVFFQLQSNTAPDHLVPHAVFCSLVATALPYEPSALDYDLLRAILLAHNHARPCPNGALKLPSPGTRAASPLNQRDCALMELKAAKTKVEAGIAQLEAMRLRHGPSEHLDSLLITKHDVLLQLESTAAALTGLNTVSLVRRSFTVANDAMEQALDGIDAAALMDDNRALLHDLALVDDILAEPLETPTAVVAEKRPIDTDTLPRVPQTPQKRRCFSMQCT